MFAFHHQVASKAASASSLGDATNQAMTDIGADIASIKTSFERQQTIAANSAVQARQAEATAQAALTV